MLTEEDHKFGGTYDVGTGTYTAATAAQTGATITNTDIASWSATDDAALETGTYKTWVVYITDGEVTGYKGS